MALSTRSATLHSTPPPALVLDLQPMLSPRIDAVVNTTIVAVVDGLQYFLTTCAEKMHCKIKLQNSASRFVSTPSPRNSTISVYTLHNQGPSPIALVAVVSIMGRILAAPSAQPGGGGWLFDVGILYEGWHGFASDAQRQVAAMGGDAITVEDVIRSNGSLVLHDVLEKYNLTAAADSFYYQGGPNNLSSVVPDFYCIYRKRANESQGFIPDCAGINATLLRHANQLTGAGVTYVVFDGTNLGSPTREAEVIQVRPLEVAFETWSAMRAQGVTTPSIAAWQTITAGSTLWQNVLDLYNAYPDMVYKDPISGKLVVFLPDTGSDDPTIVAALESNGGRNNVIVQGMWAEFDPHEYSQGKWGFFSPCMTNGAYDNSVVGRGRGISGCGQAVSTGGNLGASITASPAWQLGYGSVAFGSANKYNGVTFKRQFGTMFDNLAACWESSGGAPCSDSSLAPPHIMISSFNEWVAQPQANPYNNEFSYSVGLPWDPERVHLWVDSFGDSMSRDIEPSTLDGSRIFDIMTSCLRVARIAAAAETILLGDRTVDPTSALQTLLRVFGRGTSAASGGSASCGVVGEECCAFNVTTDEYAVVWSLGLDTGADMMASALSEEVQTLTQPGGGWAQICNAFATVSDFCVDSSLTSTELALRGPFVLFAGGCGLNVSDVTPGVDAEIVLPGRVPLVRCYDGVHHFLSNSALCPAPPAATVGPRTVPDEALGCASTARDSNLARALRMCQVSATAPAPEHSEPFSPHARTMQQLDRNTANNSIRTSDGGIRYAGTLRQRSPVRVASSVSELGPESYPTPNVGVFYHVLDGPCSVGDTDLGTLGYVR